MSLDHDAIRKAYPDAGYINSDTGAFRADGTKINLVQSAIDSARDGTSYITLMEIVG